MNLNMLLALLSILLMCEFQESLFDMFVVRYCYCYCYCYCTVLYCTVLYCTVLHCTALYCTVLYCTVLYCTVLYCTALYRTVLYCTVSKHKHFPLVHFLLLCCLVDLIIFGYYPRKKPMYNCLCKSL